MTALCSKSDEPALAQKVFDEGVKKLLLENPASSNERHLHPKRPVKDQARFIRTGSDQKTKMAVFTHLPAIVPEASRAQLLRCIQFVWSERDSIKLTADDYAHLKQLGESRMSLAPSPGTPATPATAKRPGEPKGAAAKVLKLQEQLDVLTKKNAVLEQEQRMSGPQARVVHASGTEMHIFVESGEHSRFRSHHDQSRRFLTVDMVRPSTFPSKYLEGRGPIAQTCTFALNLATELASPDGKIWEGRLVNGKEKTRTYDATWSVHCLVYKLEPPPEDIKVDESYGELD
uniref:Uncharacterized protein n=1 Tax=Haptolina ericina TaxID=156174 RepID=A0A7S3FMB8_9EUKA